MAALIGTTRPTQRQKANVDTRDPAGINQRTYNEAAGAVKQLPILGHLIPKGPANVASEAQDTGQTFAFYNSDTVTHFVVITDTSPPVASSSPTLAIALPPLAYTTLAMRECLYYIADSATVYAYWVNDQTYWK